jgi:hypothetical protein
MATARVIPNPYDTLIQGQYTGNLKLKEQNVKKYFGPNFNLTDTPTTWSLQLGRYAGRYHDHAVDLHGYWIFKQGVNQCWQAVERGGGPLQFWNADGHAAGAPEDWELFTIYEVSKPNGTVSIYNTSYMPYITDTTGHVPNNPQCYVGLTGAAFDCSETSANAAVFHVEFV